MQVALILALVAAATAAPTQPIFYSGANNVVEPQFPQGFVASGVVPTTYAAGIGAGNFQGIYFGGVPGTYVRNDDDVKAAVAPIPKAVTTYSAFPQTFSGFPQTYSAFPQTYSAFPQGISAFPAATYYSAASAPVVYSPTAFPKSVQQNEGARLIEF